jgi:hypothetical protein
MEIVKPVLEYLRGWAAEDGCHQLKNLMHHGQPASNGPCGHSDEGDDECVGGVREEPDASDLAFASLDINRQRPTRR